VGPTFGKVGEALGSPRTSNELLAVGEDGFLQRTAEIS